MQMFDSPAARIAKFKGELLKHAVPVEVLAIGCDHKTMPKNMSDTVVYRRFLPYGATTTNSTTINTISVDPLAHETQEGVTPDADQLTPNDITVKLREYACLYQYSNKVADLYEDDIPAEMKIQTGERMGLVREMVRYGVLKGCTNKFYSGGTTRATVDEGLTLNQLRRVQRSLSANRGKMVNRVLAPSANYATTAVEPGYIVFCHTNLESDIRDLPGFVPVASYGTRKPMHEMEIGSTERYRFVCSPELNGYADSGAAIGSTGLYSTTGANIDVYPVIVCALDSYADVALRGMNSFSPSHIPPSRKDSSDPLGQRGYVGARFYDAAFIQNDGWMAVIEVGLSSLTA